MAYIYRFGGNKKARSAYCKTRKFYIGGLEGNRTLDLCVANAALSQLSYKPVPSHSRIRSNALLLTALL